MKGEGVRERGRGKERGRDPIGLFEVDEKKAWTLIMRLPYVSSEGGPLILLDAWHLRSWHGVEGDDYARACGIVESERTRDGGIIPVNDNTGLVWNIGGSGSVFIVQREPALPILIRYWHDEDLSTESLEGLAARISWEGGRTLGNIEVCSGRLAILWAVENGSELKLPAAQGRISGNTSIEDSGYVITFPSRRASALLAEGVWSGVQTRALTFK